MGHGTVPQGHNGKQKVSRVGFNCDKQKFTNNIIMEKVSNNTHHTCPPQWTLPVDVPIQKPH